MVVKNWPNDLRLNCMANVNFKDYIKFEVVVVEKIMNLLRI
jgi:hypothetical protein